METTVYMVRHARSVSNASIIRGRLPGFPLDDRGKKTALRTAQYFRGRKIAAIFTSPILRAKQTAEQISKVVKRKPITRDEINEWNVWKIEGKKTIDLNPFELLIEFVFFPQIVNWGEKPTDVQKRVTAFIKRVITEYKGKEIIIVTHSDCIRWSRLHFQGLPMNFHRLFRTNTGSVTKLVFDDGELKKVEYFEP